jgi:hypothetical protein
MAESSPCGKRTLLVGVLLLAVAGASFGAGFVTRHWLAAKPDAAEETPWDQNGEVLIAFGQTGVVKFQQPFRRPPYVELVASPFGKNLITEVTADGFIWKNVGPDDQYNSGRAKWTAKGVRP